MTPLPKHPENKTQTRSAVSPAREPARDPPPSRSSECHELVVPERRDTYIMSAFVSGFRHQAQKGQVYYVSFRIGVPTPSTKRAGILCQLSHWGSDTKHKKGRYIMSAFALGFRHQAQKGQVYYVSFRIGVPTPSTKRAGILCQLSHWGSDTNAKVDIIYIIRRCGYASKRTQLWVYGRPSAPVIRLESPLPGDLLSGFSLRRRFWGVPDGQRALPFETRSRMEFVERAVPTASSVARVCRIELPAVVSATRSRRSRRREIP